MFGLDTLDLLIGLVTIYLAFAVACTAIVEAISAWFRLRARNLEDAMGEFLHGDLDARQSFVQAFYDHPLIQTLSKGKNGRPSYLPPALVGRVVESIVLAKTAADVAGDTAERLKQAIDALPTELSAPDGGAAEPNRIKELLQAFLSDADATAGEVSENFRQAVSAHFDMSMERASGWFKRQIQFVTLCTAALLVGMNNVDTVAIAKVLAVDPGARSALVGLAAAQVKATDRLGEIAERARAEEGSGAVPAPAVGGVPAPAQTAEEPPLGTNQLLQQATQQSVQAVSAMEDAVRTLEASEIPLGWSAADLPATPEGWLVKFAGLAVSVFAVMLGAPFWFGVLQQFNSVRSTGGVPKPEEETVPQK
jgi:hypothetical protein